MRHMMRMAPVTQESSPTKNVGIQNHPLIFKKLRRELATS
jgi:hypothetical protein